MRKLLLIAAVLLAIAGPARAAPCPGVSPWSFSDVDASDPFCAYMTWMAQQGITTGCKVIDATNRLYCPADFVTRSQMAAFMNRLANAAGDQLFASVNDDGSLARGRHAVSSFSFGNGAYEVIFDRDVSTCGFTATVGEAGIGSAIPGQVGVTRRTANVNGVYIRTMDSSGTYTDRPFYLIVVC